MLYVTVDSRETARNIAKHMVEKGLVACVNIFQVESIYSWQGEIEQEEEWTLIMKTRDELVKDAISEVVKVHPYEVPCAVSYPMGEGHKEYLEWIDEVTGTDSQKGRGDSWTAEGS